MVNKSRGAVAPGKKQTNWRIRKDYLDKLEEEAQRRGFATVPALVNTILAERYANENK